MIKNVNIYNFGIVLWGGLFGWVCNASVPYQSLPNLCSKAINSDVDWLSSMHACMYM